MKPDRSGSSSYPLHLKPSWRTRLPFFYGWVVVGSTCVSVAIAIGLYYSFSVFFMALLEEFGWDRGPTASVFSVFVLFTGFGAAPAGALIDRFGPGRVAALGGTLLATGLVATSRVSELWQFYLFYGVLCGMGVALAGWVPCVTLLSRWFTSRLGIAMGILSAGIGVGMVVVVPMSQYFISTMGWRTAYLLLAAVALAGIVPQAALLQVGRPEELGLRADGAAGGSASPTRARRTSKVVVVDQKWAGRQWLVGEAVRTARFWLLFANLFLCTVTNQMMWVHQAAYLVDSGLDRFLAAFAVGFAGFAGIPAKIFWGTLADRLGRERTYSMGISVLIVSLVLLVLIRTMPSMGLVLLFALVFATGYSVTAPVGPLAATDIFAGRSFGAIYGVLSIGAGIGSALGAWLAGYVFDVTGSYFVAFGVAGVCSSASVLCLWLAAPRLVRRVSRV